MKLKKILLIFVVFFAIYSILKFSIYIRVNNEIKTEVTEHLQEIEVIENCVLLIEEEEWKLSQFNKVEELQKLSNPNRHCLYWGLNPYFSASDLDTDAEKGMNVFYRSP